MVRQGGRGTPEEFMDWAAAEWPSAQIPASDAISLAGGAAAALIALGIASESVVQEWLESFKHRVHEIRASKSGGGRPTTLPAEARDAGFPRVAIAPLVSADLAHQGHVRILSVELWPDGEIVVRFVARANAGELHGLSGSIGLSTGGGDSIQPADGHFSARSDGVIYGEQRFSLADRQASDDLILSVGDNSRRIVWG